jgi:hypothetical protein
MYIYKKRAIGCLSWATFKLLSVYTKYWKMEYPPPIPRIEITSTLWINVSLYKNISIPQWDSMTKMIGQLIGDKTEVLLFGTAMADNVSIDFGITGVNMIELSTTLAKGAEAEKILGTASLVIERILK